MKITLIIPFVLLILVSCGDSDPTSPPDPTPKGTVDGTVQSILGPSQALVSISGASQQNVTPNNEGRFSLELPVGNYSARVLFPGDSSETMENFTISEGATTTVSLTQQSQNISVKVYVDDTANSTPQLANDTDRQVNVSIQQNDLYLEGTSNVDGLTNFNIGSDAFSVTIQKDISDLGIVYRSSRTIHFETPPVNGEIGVILGGGDFNLPTPNQTGTISGTINNVPAIPVGYQLIIRIKEINIGISDQTLFSAITSEIPATASLDYNFTLPVGNYKISAFIEQISTTPPIDYLSAVFVPTRQTVLANSNAQAPDMDFTNAVTFETINNLSLTNISPDFNGQTVDLSIGSFVTTSDDLFFSFATFYSDSTNQIPTSGSFITQIPINQGISTNKIYFRIEGDAGLQEYEFTPTQAAISADMLSLPEVISPNQTNFTVAQTNRLPLQWNCNPVDGVEIYIIASDDPNTVQNETGFSNLNEIRWQITLNASNSLYNLPNTPLAIFNSGGNYTLLTECVTLDNILNTELVYTFDILNYIPENGNLFRLTNRALNFVVQ